MLFENPNYPAPQGDQDLHLVIRVDGRQALSRPGNQLQGKGRVW